MKIAIVDDDIEFSNKFKQLIYPFFKDRFNNVEMSVINTNFKEVLEVKKFDIFFIDIDLKEITGIKLASILKKVDYNSIIIFVSSRSELVFDALSAQPFQFIRKSNLLENIQIATNLLNNYFKTQSKLITVDLYGRKTSIRISDIIYIESTGHDITIITNEDEYTYRSSIKEILEKIDSKFFVRIQKSIAINFDYVQEINKNDVILKNKNVFGINRHYKKQVLESYKEYLLK